MITCSSYVLDESVELGITGLILYFYYMYASMLRSYIYGLSGEGRFLLYSI
jgi:hypothetical protein